MNRRCINCGGYEDPSIFAWQTDVDMGCTCEGDLRPIWKVKRDEAAKAERLRMYNLDTDGKRQDAEIQAKWEGFYAALDGSGWRLPHWIIYQGASSVYADEWREGYDEGVQQRQEA